MPYRVYRRVPITAGRWYHTVPCKGCSSLIYLFDDPSYGTKPVRMVGDGEISTPCPLCFHDGLYSVNDISVAQATIDIEGARPERVVISKSSRKPLTTAFPKAHATFGVGYVEDRPQAAAIIGRIVTSWADIEVQCARLLGELLETGIPAVAAVFSSLRSGRAQHDALEAAAKVVLDNADYELFAAHMARRASLEKERNDLAHGCFGISVALPNAVIWASQPDFLTFTSTINHDPDALRKFRGRQAVYEIGTLERIAQEIEEYYNQLGSFRGYLSTRRDGHDGAAFRAKQYPQLCSQSHIRQALDSIRAAKKASQSRNANAKRERKQK